MGAAARKMTTEEARAIASVILCAAARDYVASLGTLGEDGPATEGTRFDLESAAVRFAMGLEVEDEAEEDCAGIPVEAEDLPEVHAFLADLEKRHAAGRIRIPLREVRRLRARLVRCIREGAER